MEPKQAARDRHRDASPVRFSRAGLFGRSFAVLGALGGSAIGASKLAASVAQQSPAQDQEILSFALLIERLHAAFYAEALRNGHLTGEPCQFAEVVGGQEQAQIKCFTDALGPSAPKSPKFHFGDATSDPAKFIATAISLEQAGLAVYNGQAVNLTPKTLAAAASRRVRGSSSRGVGAGAWAQGPGPGCGRCSDHRRAGEARVPALSRVTMSSLDHQSVGLRDFDVDGAVHETFERFQQETRAASEAAGVGGATDSAGRR